MLLIFTWHILKSTCCIEWCTDNVRHGASLLGTCFQVSFQLYYLLKLFDVLLVASKSKNVWNFQPFLHEYLRWPVTFAIIRTPSSKKELHILEIFLGTCPTICPPSFFTATAYLSTTLPISRSQVSSSPKIAVQYLL